MPISKELPINTEDVVQFLLPGPAFEDHTKQMWRGITYMAVGVGIICLNYFVASEISIDCCCGAGFALWLPGAIIFLSSLKR